MGRRRAVAGLGVGDALGGFTGALIGMGIPELEAKRYEGRLENGGVLVRSAVVLQMKSSVQRKP